MDKHQTPKHAAFSGNGLFYTIRLSVTVICLFLISPPFAFSQDMRLGAFDYPPFYSEENGEIQGIAVELINELFGRMNIKTQLSMYPIKRALKYMKDRKTDGMMILIKTAEREEYLHYTDPIITVRGLIWSAADRKGGAVNFNRLEDLKSYKIGVTLGYSYGQEFDNILKTMNVHTASTDYDNYKKLLAHKIDIFPGNEIVAKGLFKKYPEFQGKFVHSDKSFIEWVLHMGISKKSQFVPMIPRINAVLADLKNEGFIDKTVKNYLE
jgi:polar amino acid transport system substrate-binding protein